MPKASSALHSLIFSKAAFPKRTDVMRWLRYQKYARSAAVREVGGEWHVRQNAPDISGMEKRRVVCDPGVEAVIGMPRMTRSRGPVPLAVVAEAFRKSRFSPLPLMPPIGGASGPGKHTPPMPDFQSIFSSPESKKRQDKEAEQADDRRRSVWRDLNYSGLHGKPNAPELRYHSYEASQKHYLTAEQIKQHQKRIQHGTLGYETVLGEGTKRRKKGKVDA